MYEHHLNEVLLFLVINLHADALFLEGKETDFYFDYEPIYAAKAWGNPDKIKFYLRNERAVLPVQIQETALSQKWKKSLSCALEKLDDNGKSLIHALQRGEIGRVEEKSGVVIVIFNARYLIAAFREGVLEKSADSFKDIKCELLYEA